MEGIFKAKTKGVYKGGKRRINRDRVRELAESGLGPAAIGREVGATQEGQYLIPLNGQWIAISSDES